MLMIASHVITSHINYHSKPEKHLSLDHIIDAAPGLKWLELCPAYPKQFQQP